MSELTLENLAWTIPGLCFLFSYNRLRDVESVEFSGWMFVFFVVLIGAVTELPLKYIFGLSDTKTVLSASVIAFLIPFIIKYIFSPFVKKLDENPNFFMPSNLWSVIYFFFPLDNKDKFIKTCVDYEGKPVLVTTEEPLTMCLKQENNGTRNQESQQIKSEDNEIEKSLFIVKSTLFFGILIEFPYVATQVTDSQVIRILPLLSGYKYFSEKEKNQEEKIRWVRKYEITEDSAGIVIPRNKILNFSPYIEEEHESMVFYNENS